MFNLKSERKEPAKDMADKIAEAMEIRKKHCLKIYEKIIVSEKKLQVELTKLEPYILYFKMIYANYEKEHANELAKYDIYNLPMFNVRNASEIKELGFTQFLLTIKAINFTFEGASLLVKQAKELAEECITKIQDSSLTNKELKSIIKELEKLVAEHSVDVSDVLGFSDGYILLMKQLQAVFPEEYVKHINQE